MEFILCLFCAPSHRLLHHLRALFLTTWLTVESAGIYQYIQYIVELSQWDCDQTGTGFILFVYRQLFGVVWICGLLLSCDEFIEYESWMPAPGELWGPWVLAKPS